MTRHDWASGIGMAAVAAMALAGCGGGASDGAGDLEAETDRPGASAVEESQAAGASEKSSDGSDADTGVKVTVGDTEYVVDTSLGGDCRVGGTDPADLDIAAYGYDVESGSRVELRFSRQSAESSISGEDEYFGQLGVASGQQQWQLRTTEPLQLSTDGAEAAGSVTMEDNDGATTQVDFEVTCP